MPPWDLIERTRCFALDVRGFCKRLPATDEVDWLQYLKDSRIQHDPALLQEARELASILCAAVKTAKRNSE
jgi:hypothetical protein